MDTLKFLKIKNVRSPKRAHLTDAGIDFFVPETFNNGNDYYIQPGESILIEGGLKVKVPAGFALIFFNKSGVAAKKNLILGSCVVDEGYEGELLYNLHNIGPHETIIKPGEKIVQGILLQMNYMDTQEITILDNLYDKNSERGEGGFGSTGDK